MTDIFFSYSSKDRERVRPVRDALVAQDFQVFWDQDLPPNSDWDIQIRQHLAKSRCVLVFWSASSVVSKNVRHEAKVGEEHTKLVTVVLDDNLASTEFPIGFYSTQAARLGNWNGDQSNEEWSKLQQAIEALCMPIWTLRIVHDLKAQLATEKARRTFVESQDQSLRRELEKEVAESNAVRTELKGLRHEIDSLQAGKTAAEQELTALKENQRELKARLIAKEAELKRAADAAAATIAGLEKRAAEQAAAVAAASRRAWLRQVPASLAAVAVGAGLTWTATQGPITAFLMSSKPPPTSSFVPSAGPAVVANPVLARLTTATGGMRDLLETVHRDGGKVVPWDALSRVERELHDLRQARSGLPADVRKACADLARGQLVDLQRLSGDVVKVLGRDVGNQTKRRLDLALEHLQEVSRW